MTDANEALRALDKRLEKIQDMIYGQESMAVLLDAEEIAIIRTRLTDPGYVRVPARPEPERIDAGAQRLVSWEDGCAWPDSWDPMQVAAARQDAERVYLEMVNYTKETSHD